MLEMSAVIAALFVMNQFAVSSRSSEEPEVVGEGRRLGELPLVGYPRARVGVAAGGNDDVVDDVFLARPTHAALDAQELRGRVEELVARAAVDAVEVVDARKGVLQIPGADEDVEALGEVARGAQAQSRGLGGRDALGGRVDVCALQGKEPRLRVVVHLGRSADRRRIGVAGGREKREVELAEPDRGRRRRRLRAGARRRRLRQHAAGGGKPQKQGGSDQGFHGVSLRRGGILASGRGAASRTEISETFGGRVRI